MSVPDLDKGPEKCMTSETSVQNSHGDNPNNPAFDYKFLPLSMEAQIRRLQLTLESSRELILRVNSILQWEKQWHPTALIGGTTVLFMLLWLCDPNVLTIISISGLILTIGDYILPSVTSSLFKNEAWTSQKQKEFTDICTNIILYKTKVELWLASYFRMRGTNPKLFFTVTIIGLSILAWVGDSINNLFLTYVLVTLVILLPGMGTSGMLSKWTESMQKLFNDLLDNAKSKVGQSKKVD